MSDTELQAGPELDARMAELMGWEPKIFSSPDVRDPLRCNVRDRDGEWAWFEPSTDIAAAWEVWESPRLSGTQRLVRSVSGQYQATCYCDGRKGEAIAPTAPLAICGAVRQAIETPHKPA